MSPVSAPASQVPAPQSSEFDAQTAVTARPGGGWSAELAPGWSVGGGINGGYQLAVAGRALREAMAPLGKPDPIAISAYYLSAAVGGPATVDVDVRRDGGSLATASADLRQGDDTRITVLASFGDLAALPDDVRTTAVEPALPPVEECVPNSIAPPELREIAPLMERFDMRFHPDQIGWAVGEPSGRGEMSAWFRLPDREPDPLALLLAVDAMPPVTFDLAMPGWAPTLELSAHLRAVPAPGWLRIRHLTRNVAGGMFEEDCEVWDSAGRLVAQARQLARLPRGF